jgi:hypothetical protein
MSFDPKALRELTLGKPCRDPGKGQRLAQIIETNFEAGHPAGANRFVFL